VSGEGSQDNDVPDSELSPNAVCKTCEYSELTPLDVNLQTQRLCKRFPPSPVAIIVNMGGKPGMAIHNVFPTVSDDLYCYEYQAREGVEIIPTGLAPDKTN
jgi:hypothetical protein